MKRKEPHIYVANWFYLSFIITIAMLHLVNNMAIPVSIFGSSRCRSPRACRMR
jgi:cytochrome c oxidase cbb3-type subunit 1